MNTNQLRSEKNKRYTFTINTTSTLMTGKTMANMKYDEKQFKFEI
jgi:hypothetical protein